MWEFTGGGVLAGETTTRAAVRELEEELGISVEEKELSLLEVYKNRNYFMDIYVLKKDFEINELVLQEEEVVDAKWVKADELRQMIDDKKIVHSVAMRFEKYIDLLI